VNANTGVGGTPQALLDGFHPALAVRVAAGLLGILAMASGLCPRTAVVAEPLLDEELEVEAA
jgi:hypothetical protein